MRTTFAATASAAKILLGACAVVAATGLAASPAWANQIAQHRHFPLPVVTSTTTTTAPGARPPPAPRPRSACRCRRRQRRRPKTTACKELGRRPSRAVRRFSWPGMTAFTCGTTQMGVGRSAPPTSGRATGSSSLGRCTPTAGSPWSVVCGTRAMTSWRSSANHRTILFRFVNYGAVDGLDFATHCSTGFSASFYIEGTLAPTSSVHLGANEVNPTSNPFEVARVQSSLGSDGGIPTTTTTTTPAATTPAAVA